MESYEENRVKWLINKPGGLCLARRSGTLRRAGGLPHAQVSGPEDGIYSEFQPYKFGGKEYDEMFGLNWSDFGARFYSGIVPGFMTMDPLCEKYYPVSPYAYCANNPVNLVDPTGMDSFEGNKSDFVDNFMRYYPGKEKQYYDPETGRKLNIDPNTMQPDNIGAKGDIIVGDDGNTYELSCEDVVVTARGPEYVVRRGMIYAWSGSGYYRLVGEKGLENVYPEFDILMIGRGLFNMFGNVAKGGTSGLKTYGSLTEKFGTGYESVAVTQGKHLPIELGQKLNTMSPGSWSKVYEAGILNGSRVETHYFFNATTGEYVNPFIKSSGWGRAFRGVTGY